MHRATEQNLPDAQTRLARHYEHGRGVPRDEIAAYMWYTLGAQQGHPGAKDEVERLARSLSNSQIEQAEALAQEWIGRRDR